MLMPRARRLADNDIEQVDDGGDFPVVQAMDGSGMVVPPPTRSAPDTPPRLEPVRPARVAGLGVGDAPPPPDDDTNVRQTAQPITAPRPMTPPTVLPPDVERVAPSPVGLRRNSAFVDDGSGWEVPFDVTPPPSKPPTIDGPDAPPVGAPETAVTSGIPAGFTRGSGLDYGTFYYNGTRVEGFDDRGNVILDDGNGTRVGGGDALKKYIDTPEFAQIEKRGMLDQAGEWSTDAKMKAVLGNEEYKRLAMGGRETDRSAMSPELQALFDASALGESARDFPAWLAKHPNTGTPAPKNAGPERYMIDGETLLADGTMAPSQYQQQRTINGVTTPYRNPDANPSAMPASEDSLAKLAAALAGRTAIFGNSAGTTSTGSTPARAITPPSVARDTGVGSSGLPSKTAALPPVVGLAGPSSPTGGTGAAGSSGITPATEPGAEVLKTAITGNEAPVTINPAQSDAFQQLLSGLQAESLRQLAQPTAWDDELAKKVKDQAAQSIGEDYDNEESALRSELGRRGIAYTDIAGQQYQSLGNRKASRLAQLDTDIAQKRADAIAAGRQSAFSNASGLASIRAAIEKQYRDEQRGERGYLDDLDSKAQQDAMNNFLLENGLANDSDSSWMQLLNGSLNYGSAPGALSTLGQVAAGYGSASSAYGRQANEQDDAFQSMIAGLFSLFGGGKAA